MAQDHNDIVKMLLEQSSKLLADAREAADVINNEVSSAPQAAEVSELDSLTSTTESINNHKEVAVYSTTYNADDFGGIPEPQCWTDLRDCMNAGVDKVLLYGAPGIGKTFAGLFYGDVARGAERLTCTEDMTSFNVGGGMSIASDGSFVWQDGAALRAWKNGSRLIVDEIDKAGGDVFAELLAFTDTVDSASFTVLSTGEVFRPQPGFSVVMTSNIEHPDELPPALKDRFSCAIQINAPHPAALMRFPENQRMLAATLVSGKPGQRVSLRQMQLFNQLIKDSAFTIERAARIAFNDTMAAQIVQALQVGTLSVDASL